MARHVFARLLAGSSASFEFAVKRGDRWQFVEPDRFKPAGDDHVTVLVPGTEVAIHRVLMPARSEKEAYRAAPFAIEDELAEPVEAVHVAIGKPEKDGEQVYRDIHVCARVQMDDWVAQIKDAGLKRAALVAEQAVLPDENLVVQAGDRILFACKGRRFVAETDMADDVLLALAGTCDGSSGIYGVDLAKRLGNESAMAGDAADLVQLAEWGEATETLVDLRQGTYATRSASVPTDISAWKLPAILAAAAALAWISATVFETSVLRQRGANNLAEAQAIYAETFPAEGIVSNPAQRIRSKINAGDAGGEGLDFMTASAALYQAIREVDGASIKSLRYERGGGSVHASLQYRNYGDDGRVKTALEASGFQARIGDTRQSGSAVLGEIEIGGAS